jgi:hypothetical protein
MREGTNSRFTAADMPYGEFYDFYSVSPENFVSTLVYTHSVVSAGWKQTIDAFPPGQVLRNIAERKQWVL